MFTVNVYRKGLQLMFTVNVYSKCLQWCSTFEGSCEFKKCKSGNAPNDRTKNYVDSSLPFYFLRITFSRSLSQRLRRRKTLLIFWSSQTLLVSTKTSLESKQSWAAGVEQRHSCSSDSYLRQLSLSICLHLALLIIFHFRTHAEFDKTSIDTLLSASAAPCTFYSIRHGNVVIRNFNLSLTFEDGRGCSITPNKI